VVGEAAVPPLLLRRVLELQIRSLVVIRVQKTL
jgi:hypothetical protein